MQLIQLGLALVIIGVLYARMISRETPQPIGKVQAIVPVALGLLSVPLSFAFVMGFALAMTSAGLTVGGINVPVLRSLAQAFFAAGFPEELAKLLMLLVSVVIFKPKNVYEYVIAGAGVGFGFTLLEEFFYGGGLEALVRIPTIALHVVFGIIMGRHLGLARHSKVTGEGSATTQYILTFVAPALIHTVYDACLVSNPLISNGDSLDDLTLGIGLAVAFGMMAVATVYQIVLFIRIKKSAQELSSMETR